MYAAHSIHTLKRSRRLLQISYLLMAFLFLGATNGLARGYYTANGDTWHLTGTEDELLPYKLLSPSSQNSTCSCTNGININAIGGRTISSLVGDGTLTVAMLNNTCLSIEGTLIVDVDYIIDGGEILMHPGATIILPDQGNADLMLTNINQNGGIHGCGEQMWRHIRVEAGCTLDMNNCQVEDAQYAIFATHLSKILLTDNDFNRNFIGIYVAPDAVPQNINRNIKGNTFRSEGADLLPTVDQFLAGLTYDVNLLNITYAGILLHDVNGFTIGGSGNEKNTFRAVHRGIIADNVLGLNIYDNDFIDINSQNLPFGSYAILVSQTDMEIVRAYFNNCYYGIIAYSPSNGGTIIRNTIMEAVSYGIGINSIEDNSINIRDNEIEARYTGISAFDSYPTGELIIEDNMLTTYADLSSYEGIVVGVGPYISEIP